MRNGRSSSTNSTSKAKRHSRRWGSRNRGKPSILDANLGSSAREPRLCAFWDHGIGDDPEWRWPEQLRPERVWIVGDTAYWDDAYSNGAHIQGGDAYPAKWNAAAAQFRAALSAAGRAELDQAYGRKPRERFDLFMPTGGPMGLFVFVHGGYWLAFDKSSWSHLA